MALRLASVNLQDEKHLAVILCTVLAAVLIVAILAKAFYMQGYVDALGDSSCAILNMLEDLKGDKDPDSKTVP